MKDLLLGASAVIIIMQAVIIYVLVNLINKTRKEKRSLKQQSRKLISSILKTTVEYYDMAIDYKDAYTECYAEYKSLFRENKQKDIRLKENKYAYDTMCNAYHKVCGNLCDLIKEGKIIKQKHNGNVTTLEFNELTKQNIIELFGTEII